MRAASLVLLSGCSLVWGVEDYRGDEIDAGSDAMADAVIDAPEDAHDDVDAGIDAGIDASVDSRVDAPSTCILSSQSAPIEVATELRGRTLTYGGSGPAIRVTGSNVMIENVDITLSGSAVAIEVDPSIDTLLIQNVRIRMNEPPTSGAINVNQFAIDIDGAPGSIRDVQIRNVSIRGMEGIRLANVQGGILEDIRLDNPEGFATIDHNASRHYGILFANVDTTSLSRFTVVGGGDRPLITHAVRFIDVANIVVDTGYISAPCAGFPIQMSGRRESSPANQMTGVNVTNNPRGIDVRASHWQFADMHVVRSAGCDEDDYAYSHVGTAADMVRCGDCYYSGCASIPATLGQLDAEERAADFSVPPNLTFCFLPGP